ncbi:DUF1543 domain-containing protein [Segetibacter sp. 3557_3]|uniref:DUF1543 domain-containing protein n=1 Tax=Segetibacter sp. 3557_3 TaxID=2547429 RepID=UPI0010584E18|nr:DUF1543 domain-containing protein [Segetibacter sp. 3557_3]TDH29012.1 DUF1543 domain-containing protein [Segetibacter sp. 3557_3]
MEDLKLYMVLIGCTPKGRNTEQHDIFFGVAPSLRDLEPAMVSFWPEAAGKIHIDAWREVNYVDGYAVKVEPLERKTADQAAKLFFLNLGGYKTNEFDEFHYKMLAISTNKTGAIQQAKSTAFYKHTGFKGATSHIDDHYGVDVDDVHQVRDLLPKNFKEQYFLLIEYAASQPDDHLHLGYLTRKKLRTLK